MTDQVFNPDDVGARNVSILIVDDDPGALEAFEFMLKAEGYGVRVAPDAEAAFAEVERREPAAVVMDLHLPLTDGLETLRLLRATARHAHIPVAVVTGDYLVDEGVTNELELLGAQLYFKPLWEEDLIRIVRTLVPAA